MALSILCFKLACANKHWGGVVGFARWWDEIDIEGFIEKSRSGDA